MIGVEGSAERGEQHICVGSEISIQSLYAYIYLNTSEVVDLVMFLTDDDPEIRHGCGNGINSVLCSEGAYSILQYHQSYSLGHRSYEMSSDSIETDTVFPKIKTMNS